MSNSFEEQEIEKAINKIKKSKTDRTSKAPSGGEQLLQFAVVCLAIASFFTTAQGMRQYIFKNSTIAYVTSGAIQGILLALSMNLPKFMKQIWGERVDFWKDPLKAIGKFFGKGAIEVILLLLTAVSLFCRGSATFILRKRCTKARGIRTVAFWCSKHTGVSCIVQAIM